MVWVPKVDTAGVALRGNVASTTSYTVTSPRARIVVTATAASVRGKCHKQPRDEVDVLCSLRALELVYRPPTRLHTGVPRKWVVPLRCEVGVEGKVTRIAWQVRIPHVWDNSSLAVVHSSRVAEIVVPRPSAAVWYILCTCLSCKETELPYACTLFAHVGRVAVRVFAIPVGVLWSRWWCTVALTNAAPTVRRTDNVSCSCLAWDTVCSVKVSNKSVVWTSVVRSILLIVYSTLCCYYKTNTYSFSQINVVISYHGNN